MQPNVSPTSAELKSRLLPRLSLEATRTWLRSLRATRRPALTWMLLSIPLYAGCAAVSPGVPPIYQCRVPLSDLEATAQPPLDDKTNADLIRENSAVRAALEKSNGDKARVKAYIVERCAGGPA